MLVLCGDDFSRFRNHSWWSAGWLTTVLRQQESSTTSHVGFPASNRATHLMNMPISSRPDANHATLKDHADSAYVPAANQWGAHRLTVCSSSPAFSNSQPLTLHGLFYCKPVRQDCIHVNEFMHEHTARFSHLYFKAASLCKCFWWTVGLKRVRCSSLQWQTTPPPHPAPRSHPRQPKKS